MAKYYTDEKSVQIVIALLKAHGVRKVIASPGTTNITLVASMQHDPHFEMFSAVDERSAAYMACGLVAESGEPVILSCTGATASRNYLPGMTEAYYRKLPILAITSSQNVAKVGHHIAQVIDRSSMQNDVTRLSVTLPVIKDDDDLWECEVKANTAILELRRHGGGPAHINLPTTYSRNYHVKKLPNFRIINRITATDSFPDLPPGKIAVFAGARKTMTKPLIEALDKFCSTNNAIVFCDHTSGYNGKFKSLFSLAACQQMSALANSRPDLLIHIGEISGDYYNLKIGGKQIWRVNEDGEIRDTFRRLRYVFEMDEQKFFLHYSENERVETADYLHECTHHLNKLYDKIPELPFSNIWLASKMAHCIPEGSTIHFGILNSLRSWNFFQLPHSVRSNSNVGGFGIDGCLSSLVGASLADNNRLYFGVIGDLSFFYDMNAIGNRHVGNNLRILLINNGKGTEFRNFNHPGDSFGDNADKYIAASGHFGDKSQTLVKHYAQNLGFEYFSATNKKEFELVNNRFLSNTITEKPMLFEVFTDSVDESNALNTIMNLEKSIKGKTKKVTKKIIGEQNLKILKKIGSIAN